MTNRLARAIGLRASAGLAIVSGGFCAILAISLVRIAVGHSYPAWFEAPEFAALRAKVEADPGDARAVAELRREDRLRMQAWFDSRARLAVGGRLLAIGALALLLSLHCRAALVAGVPAPQGRRARDQARSASARSLRALPPLALGLAALALVPVWLANRPAAAQPQEQPVMTAAGPAAPAAEPAVPDSRKWPVFRGPTGMGQAGDGDFPTAWDAATGTGIIWKAALPLPGRSSPVIWGSRLFLTGGDSRSRRVQCYDTGSGTLLWDKAIGAGARIPPGAGIFKTSDADSGPASPTPVTDGRHVVALFGTGELAALDLQGNQVWAHWLGLPESAYGFAASPALFGKLVIVQFDQAGESDGRSALFAFDLETGEQAWKVPRPVGNSWSSPVAARVAGQDQILTAGLPWAIAYAPLDGRELWRADLFFGDVALSPIAAGDFAYMTRNGSDLVAIRGDSQGELAEAQVLLKAEGVMSGTASSICDGRLLLQVTDMGSAACVDVVAGGIVWEEQLSDEPFYASLTLAGGNVYLVDRKGVTRIFPLERSFRLIGQGAVNEVVDATPAFLEGRIYMRGEKHLFCIGARRP